MTKIIFAPNVQRNELVIGIRGTSNTAVKKKPGPHSMHSSGTRGAMLSRLSSEKAAEWCRSFNFNFHFN